jgi:hypothetical protein
MKELKHLRDLCEMRVDGPPEAIFDLDDAHPLSGSGEKLIVVAVKGSKISAYASNDFASLELRGVLSLIQRDMVNW